MMTDANIPLLSNMISNHFTWEEALWLPSWGRPATVNDGMNSIILTNLEDVFKKMDVVRDHFNAPIRVHCAYRAGPYNQLVGGAPNSPHLLGMAVDFDIQGLQCNYAIAHILDNDLLEVWQMRMENNGRLPSWIHLDTRPLLAGHSRYFIP